MSVEGKAATSTRLALAIFKEAEQGSGSSLICANTAATSAAVRVVCPVRLTTAVRSRVQLFKAGLPE